MFVFHLPSKSKIFHIHYERKNAPPNSNQHPVGQPNDIRATIGYAQFNIYQYM